MIMTSGFFYFIFRVRLKNTSTAPYATAPAGHGYITWAAEHHMFFLGGE
jgi:hypothetical protein